MPRPLRVQYPGATYHAMARGNRGLSVFRDDRDCKRFLQTLEETCDKTGWQIHAYVLMGSHYHLVGLKTCTVMNSTVVRCSTASGTMGRFQKSGNRSVLTGLGTILGRFQNQNPS